MGWIEYATCDKTRIISHVAYFSGLHFLFQFLRQENVGQENITLF
jgi:hypothetical protein